MDEPRVEHGGPAASAPRGEEPRGQLLLELSNAVVRLHKQYYGKGPTKARSHVWGDLVVVLLEGGYTHSEQTLLAAGHGREVSQARAAMQETAEAALRESVEQITGRPVRSFMSASDPVSDTQVEVFLLGGTADDQVEGAGV